MKAFTIKKNNLNILVEHFSKVFKVYGPTKLGLDLSFNEIKSINDLHLNHKSTICLLKNFFIFQSKLCINSKFIKKYIIQKDKKDEKFILFGVHPYDVLVILKLDKFFSIEYKDTYYQNRRKNSIIVALN